jgi:hypothetical protein
LQEQLEDDDFGGLLARSASGSDAAGKPSAAAGVAVTTQNQEALSVLIKVGVDDHLAFFIFTLALGQVRHKLEGLEGENRFSVQGHVAHLINEATDPHNLARLYCGWQAWV